MEELRNNKNLDLAAYSANGHGEVNSYTAFKMKGKHKLYRVYAYWSEKDQQYIEEKVSR